MSTDLSSEMQSILEQVAAEFETTTVFNQWMPPDGTYTALITAYTDGVTARGSSKYVWWKLDGRLLTPNDAELNEKDFTVGFYRSTALGFLKAAISVLAGRKINDIRQATGILDGAVGWVVTVRVNTTQKDESSPEYKNVTITEVVQKNEG